MARGTDRLSVAHVVPSLVIGGVEMGVVKSIGKLRQQIEYNVYYVKTPGPLRFEQRPAWKLLLDMALRRKRVDVVVSSLWASHLVGMVAQRLGAKWAAFFHSSGICHGVEKAVFAMAWKSADMRLADSADCGRAMSKLFGEKSWHTINYLFPSDHEALPWAQRTTDIVFVGRIAEVKRLDLVVALVEAFARRQRHFSAVFAISGIPSQELLDLGNRYPGKVRIDREVPNAEVQALLINSRFFVSLSDVEGFSMATAEAVLAGALPVVRPVGEIGNYVSADSGIIVGDTSAAGLQQVAQRMENVAAQPETAQQMTVRGRRKMLELYHPYVDGFLQRVTELAHG